MPNFQIWVMVVFLSSNTAGERLRDQRFLRAKVFLLFPLSASSLCCVCVARYLSCGSSCPAGERTHALSAKRCHIMSLFGL